MARININLTKKANMNVRIYMAKEDINNKSEAINKLLEEVEFKFDE